MQVKPVPRIAHATARQGVLKTLPNSPRRSKSAERSDVGQRIGKTTSGRSDENKIQTGKSDPFEAQNAQADQGRNRIGKELTSRPKK